MQHYNKAIQQILTSQVEHLDSVVMACLAFIRIEFLLGNIKGAYTHYHHGKVLLKSYNPSQQLLTIFRRLDIFILLFSQLADLSSVDDAAIMTSDEKPGNSDKSEKVIDWLARRSMRMTLLFSELSSTSSPLLVPMASPASSVSSQAIPAVDPILKQTLDSWSLAVACLVVSNSLRPDKTELDCMLQARLLVCKLSLIMETHAGVPNRVNEAKPGRLVGIISDVMGFDSNLTVEAINLGAKITCRALICASNMDKSDLNMEDIEKGLGIGED
ncbi:hypothetical protein N7456_008789 [Penicillium angulare]|uniref:Uncharacterized protein n=1 Tax=Penicillium angulare TaxID=116970 RepID=A0A9W9F3B8_9EURO|nr:hypothetical protein N7456_008789 [Penicillium angulare]